MIQDHAGQTPILIGIPYPVVYEVPMRRPPRPIPYREPFPMQGPPRPIQVSEPLDTDDGNFEFEGPSWMQ